MVIADPILRETGAVGLVVEVVRLGQMGQQPATIAGERAAGEELLHCGSEARRFVPCDSAEDGVTVVAKVGAEQCEQFKNHLVCDLVGNLGSRWVAPGVVADLLQGPAAAFNEPAVLPRPFGSARGPGGLGGFPLVGEATIRRCTRYNKSFAKQDAQAMASSGLGDDMSSQPGSQEALGMLAGPPWGLVFKQQRDDRLDGDDVDDAVVVTKPLIDQAGEPSQAGGVIGEQSGPRVP